MTSYQNIIETLQCLLAGSCMNMEAMKAKWKRNLIRDCENNIISDFAPWNHCFRLLAFGICKIGTLSLRKHIERLLLTSREPFQKHFYQCCDVFNHCPPVVGLKWTVSGYVWVWFRDNCRIWVGLSCWTLQVWVGAASVRDAGCKGTVEDKLSMSW